MINERVLALDATVRDLAYFLRVEAFPLLVIEFFTKVDDEE